MSLIAEVIELVDLVSELAVGVVDKVLDMAIQDLALVRVLVVDEYIKVNVSWYKELASGVGSLDILPKLVLIMVFNHPMPKDFHPQQLSLSSRCINNIRHLCILSSDRLSL